MAYFSNGEEGRTYQAKWCFRCVHWGPDVDNDVPGCAVWDAHLLYAYDGTEEQRRILDMLIPRDPDGWPARCNTFHPDEEPSHA